MKSATVLVRGDVVDRNIYQDEWTKAVHICRRKPSGNLNSY